MTDTPLDLHRSYTRDLDVATLYRILRLRVDVFVVEQACPYPELDGRDLEPRTRQLWVTNESGAVVATLRLLRDNANGESNVADSGADDAHFRIGRVCTDRAFRGQGLTGRLMTTALAEVGERPCRIEAQTYLTEMYAKFGFIVDSEEYLEDGIPHVSMLRPGTVAARGSGA